MKSDNQLTGGGTGVEKTPDDPIPEIKKISDSHEIKRTLCPAGKHADPLHDQDVFFIGQTHEQVTILRCRISGPAGTGNV